MLRRNLRSNTTDYRELLAGRGEISVGAFARQQFRRRLVLAAFGLALISLSVLLYGLLRPREADRPSATYVATLGCTACDFRGAVRVAAGTVFPCVCPRCHQKSCQRVWVCQNCGHEFLAHPAEDEQKCPKCHSLRVGSKPPP